MTLRCVVCGEERAGFLAWAVLCEQCLHTLDPAARLPSPTLLRRCRALAKTGVRVTAEDLRRGL